MARKLAYTRCVVEASCEQIVSFYRCCHKAVCLFKAAKGGATCKCGNTGARTATPMARTGSLVGVEVVVIGLDVL